MSRLCRARADQDRGAHLVEMAVVMVLLFIILAGVIDIGGMYVSYVAITNAAREGARYASHFPHMEAEIKQATIQEAAGSGVVISPDNVTVVGLFALPGQPIQVRVEYPFETIMGGVTGIGTITLRTANEMIVFGADT